MEQKNIKSLNRKQILSLPGFFNEPLYQKSLLKELKIYLNQILDLYHINHRGVKVREYLKAYQKDLDDALFASIGKKKKQQQTKKQSRTEYKQSLKQNALEERNILNINAQYQSTKSAERKYYEENVNDKTKFEKEMKNMMKDIKNRIGFTVDIGDDSEKLYAFTKALRYLHQHYNYKDRIKPFIQAYDLENRKKQFTLSNSIDIENLVSNILGTIDVESQFSDDAPEIVNETFIPDKFTIAFVDYDKNGKKTRFSSRIRDSNTNKIKQQEFEITDDFRSKPDGSFFPYINTTNIDLTTLQIFNKIEKKNYRDSCFVYACIQSNIFDKHEIQHLRSIIQTRSLPNNRIVDIAKHFKCNFVIKRIDETYDTENQMRQNIDTRKTKYGKSFNRCIELLLFKNHYMIYKKLPITTYYIKHKDELDEKFQHLSQKDRQLIRGLNTNGYPKFAKDGTLPMKILRTMFDCNMFREINQCELNILSTVEFDNHLNDYVELDYPQNLCCFPENQYYKEPIQWSNIYYADFETNITGEKHVPYLCCVCHKENNRTLGIKFTGDSISTELLDYLENNSLTYFHNLKYDACFFINESQNDWKIELTQRSGTVLQIVMDKYIDIVDSKTNKTIHIRSKHLTFRNSYSIIPAPLSKFADMFKLKTHKELIPYRIYTQHNINRQNVSALEFQLQYYNENVDKLGMKQTISNIHQLIENAKYAKTFNTENLTINILEYAYFYCIRDCVVLMDGMNQFDKDLKHIFTESKHSFPGIHQYLSISSVGYDFARIYGCFNGCYRLSGKPQNFIQRCVNGGRTMTANNEKQYIVGKIQDFDAVSLYPSAMSIMDGVPKGIPHVIDKSITKEQLMKYDTFFIEINITKIESKCKDSYKFGQVFKSIDGHKIYCNETVSNFYVDKIALLDLIEFYNIEYDIVRGYYFNDGFNNTINKFIKMLFDLRLRYKQSKNPLEQTIKLLLNSIYGKSILKPMKEDIKLVPLNKLTSYIYRNYNFIKEITIEDNISKAYVKKIKPINNHFNLPQFGVSVLSWSKHIMNQVMCTAEQNNIPIFYQDTDSMHLFESDVDKLATIYREKYGKTLIGKNMCQFHCDFDSFDGANGNVHSRKLIALGKKSYLDILVDEDGKEGYHIRMKGICNQCILNKCKRMKITVEELYEKMYNGMQIEFDLTDGSNCFKKTKTFNQITLPQFIRRVKF